MSRITSREAEERYQRQLSHTRWDWVRRPPDSRAPTTRSERELRLAALVRAHHIRHQEGFLGRVPADAPPFSGATVEISWICETPIATVRYPDGGTLSYRIDPQNGCISRD